MKTHKVNRSLESGGIAIKGCYSNSSLAVTAGRFQKTYASFGFVIQTGIFI